MVDLKLKPCKIQIHPRLPVASIVNRRVICHWLLKQIAQDDVMENVWFIEEAHFYLIKQMNSKNFISRESLKPKGKNYEISVHD